MYLLQNQKFVKIGTVSSYEFSTLNFKVSVNFLIQTIIFFFASTQSCVTRKHVKKPTTFQLFLTSQKGSRFIVITPAAKSSDS